MPQHPANIPLNPYSGHMLGTLENFGRQQVILCTLGGEGGPDFHGFMEDKTGWEETWDPGRRPGTLGGEGDPDFHRFMGDKTGWEETWDPNVHASYLNGA